MTRKTTLSVNYSIYSKVYLENENIDDNLKGFGGYINLNGKYIIVPHTFVNGLILFNPYLNIA